jgi:hypothetical protein
VAAAICLIPVVVSYVQAITARSNSSLGIRIQRYLTQDDRDFFAVYLR